LDQPNNGDISEDHEQLKEEYQEPVAESQEKSYEELAMEAALLWAQPL
jgi:hypothetical protein